MSAAEFIRVIGPVFEHSPWIAERALAVRPFADHAALHRRLREIVLRSPKEKQIALIQAHPDLVGRAFLRKTLTPESQREQASAGLAQASPEERQQLQNYNASYRGRFGFPFVICARLNKKEAILKTLPERLNNSREKEIETALKEIFKIARLRLDDFISE